jgi:uncharacterized membrane protein YbaN (DUF454 family)
VGERTAMSGGCRNGPLEIKGAADRGDVAAAQASEHGEAQARAQVDTEEASPRQRVRERGSPLLRGLLLAAGTLCVAVGTLGLFLPLLPTTPFLLLAAACYARASRRLYDRLLANRTFGPLIYEWREHRSIPYRTKIGAIALMGSTLTASILFAVEPLWLKAVLALLGLALALWLYRLPSRPADSLTSSARGCRADPAPGPRDLPRS